MGKFKIKVNNKINKQKKFRQEKFRENSLQCKKINKSIIKIRLK